MRLTEKKARFEKRQMSSVTETTWENWLTLNINVLAFQNKYVSGESLSLTLLLGLETWFWERKCSLIRLDIILLICFWIYVRKGSQPFTGQPETFFSFWFIHMSKRFHILQVSWTKKEIISFQLKKKYVCLHLTQNEY